MYKRQAAISAYNGLSGAQQELVHNYDMLEAATILYESLSAIQQVIKMIDQIGTVSQTSGPQLEAARSAYNNLTPDEQRRITNLSVLENAEAAFAALETPEVDNNDCLLYTSSIPIFCRLIMWRQREQWRRSACMLHWPGCPECLQC